MGKAVGGKTSIGCGAFGLLGLLVGVGLVVWLGSMSLDAQDGVITTTTAKPSATTSTTVASTLNDPAKAGLPAGAKVAVEAPARLSEGSRTTIYGTGFPVGPVTMSMCLTGTPPDPATRCDPATRVTQRVLEDGSWSVVFPMPRIITVGEVAYDCAAVPGGCSVLGQLDGRVDPVGASAQVFFAKDLPPTKATAPPVP